MAAHLSLRSGRFNLSGNDHVVRAALKLHGAGRLKDGSVSMPANLLSWSQISEAFPTALFEPEIEAWRWQELSVQALGRAVSNGSTQAWNLPDLWPWQTSAIARLAEGSAALFDDRGMGKTRVVIEAIRSSQADGLAPAVVVARKRLRAVWRADAERWWGAERVCVPTATTWSSAADQIGAAEITVLTYDSLLNKDIASAIRRLDPEWLVVDEIHNLKKRARKNPPKKPGKDPTDTKSGVMRSLPGRRRVAVSGSPMPNVWHEVWPLLNFVAPDVFTSFWQFVEVLGEVKESFWGGHDISQDMRRDDIWQEILDRWVIMRHRPTRGAIWDFVPVELSARERKAYDTMRKEFQVEAEDGSMLDASNALARATRLQQLAGALGTWETWLDETGRQRSKFEHADPSSKTEALLEMLPGLQRAVVFTRFRNRAEFVTRKIVDAGFAEPLLISGSTSEVATELALSRFADLAQFPDPLVAVCVFGTISEGVNELVTAHDIFFLDWLTAKDVSQAADRLDRPGQTEAVRCVTLYAENTIDEAALDREAGKVLSLRSILRQPDGWKWLIER